MSDPNDYQTGSTHKAVRTALASSGLFAVMAMMARRLSHSIPGTQVALVRFAIGVVVVLGFLAIFRANLRPRRWGWVISRGVFGGIAVLLYFTCIEKIGVGIATLLNYTAPVWSMTFAWLLLRERPRRHAFVALGLTLVGVALVTSGRAGAWRLGKWELVGACSAVVSGMAITAIRATRRQTADGAPNESSWTVFASFTILGLLTTLPTALPPLGAWVAPTPREWLLLVICGFLGVAAQLLMTSAFGMLTAVGMGIVQQTTVVLTMVGGLLFFGEPITPRAAIGSIITIAGVVWSVFADRQGSGADA
jgi:drug/metabolite transporter (DMT)-like permease